MDLRYFINQCAEANELKRVKAEVDWNLEISHVSKLTEEKKGPALLFENVKGYSTPVFTGAFATTKRLAIMLGLPHNLTMCESAQQWMKKTITSEGLIKAKEVKD
ncbi:MAG: UbiD family decarboxylase, partial [Rhodocyclaceae bacterium]|nr:UbiD family decarboxylase [Rhodocyclaceae bacterium]